MTQPASAEERRALAERIASWEERAGIIEDGAGLSRAEAEAAAARELGYRPQWSGSIVRLIDTCGP